MRPHHVEGAQRYIAFGKPTTKQMYDLLADAIAEDPDAEMEFVASVEDPICQECILATRGKCRVVLDEQLSETATIDMDQDVAKEHGWEIGRRYKIQDILDEITKEAPDRKIFYIIAALKNIEIEQNGSMRNAYEIWKEDIIASKKRTE